MLPDKYRPGRCVTASRCCSWSSLYHRAVSGLLEVWVVSVVSGTPFLVPLGAPAADDPVRLLEVVRLAQVAHDGFAPKNFDLVTASRRLVASARSGAHRTVVSRRWAQLDTVIAASVRMTRRVAVGPPGVAPPVRDLAAVPQKTECVPRLRDRHVYYQVVPGDSGDHSPAPRSLTHLVAGALASVSSGAESWGSPPGAGAPLLSPLASAVVPRDVTGRLPSLRAQPPLTQAEAKGAWLQYLHTARMRGLPVSRPCACNLQGVSLVLNATDALLGEEWGPSCWKAAFPCELHPYLAAALAVHKAPTDSSPGDHLMLPLDTGPESVVQARVALGCRAHTVGALGWLTMRPLRRRLHAGLLWGGEVAKAVASLGVLSAAIARASLSSGAASMIQLLVWEAWQVMKRGRGNPAWAAVALMHASLSEVCLGAGGAAVRIARRHAPLVALSLAYEAARVTATVTIRSERWACLLALCCLAPLLRVLPPSTLVRCGASAAAYLLLANRLGARTVTSAVSCVYASVAGGALLLLKLWLHVRSV